MIELDRGQNRLADIDLCRVMYKGFLAGSKQLVIGHRLLMNKKISPHHLWLGIDSVTCAEPTPNPSLRGRGDRFPSLLGRG